MRVIEQARLSFRDGNSDKVYEIEIVEVATNQYVVNFRFGRRGTALKDGTKTPTPVDLARARAVYHKLVAEKTAGGYRDAGTAAPAPTPARAPAPVAPVDLVGRLRQGVSGHGPLGPVVWKVTDRDMKAAEPALLDLLAATNTRPNRVAHNAWRHTLLAALARCGTERSLPALEKIATDGHNPQHVRDVARLAMVRIAPQRAGEIARMPDPQTNRAWLPPALATAYDKGDVPGLARACEELLGRDAAAARAAVVTLYLINDAVARPAVVAFARMARLATAEAGVVRAIFRFAEIRRDGDMYTLVARRIDSHTGYRPMGPRTRAYLRRRVARVLRRLGSAGSPDYTAMATSLLLQYTDADGTDPKRGGQTRAWYDRFAKHHAVNTVLYANSTRYTRGHHGRSFWKCRDNYWPAGVQTGPRTVRWDANAREEAHPALWDAAPERLWRLVVSGRATPVVEFAVRALRANTAFVAALSDDQLGTVLAQGHPLAQRFAFDMVKTRPMTATLARYALASEIAEAHAWVLSWIDANQDKAIADPEMIALLVTGKTAQVRDAALALLRGRVLGGEVAKSAAARCIAILLGLPATAADRASASVGVLLRVLDAPLREISTDVLLDMIEHPLAALGELAGELMLRHAKRDALPAQLLEALLGSPHASVRTLGGRMLALTPPEIAKDDLEALVLFATSGNRELREATRPLIAEIAKRFPDVGRALADRLVDELLRTQPEGAPANIIALLRVELAGVLPKKSPQTILKLVGALSPHARDAGGMLLSQLGVDDVGLDDIARLANNEILAIRQGAWALARAALPRYRLAPVALAKLVDVQWKDSRDFAIGFIRDDFGAAKLSADAIIAICDSIRPEVQELGKELLRDQFAAADAGRYLVRLAEHPSTSIQMLVSGLLEHHLDGDLERVRSLAPYLQTVLSQVNRGAVAKHRVLALLRRIAARDAATAALVAPILDRQSATIAVATKQPLIATMVEVHHAFPDVPLPIKVTPPAPHPRREGSDAI